MTTTTKDAASGAPDEMSLEWIQMRTEMYKMQPESFAQISVRKFKENPLVPIGKILQVNRTTSKSHKDPFRCHCHSRSAVLWPMEFPKGRQEDVPVHDADPYPSPGLHTDRLARRNRNGCRQDYQIR